VDDVEKRKPETRSTRVAEQRKYNNEEKETHLYSSWEEFATRSTRARLGPGVKRGKILPGGEMFLSV